MTIWQPPETAPTEPGTKISLRIQVANGDPVESDGHVTEGGRLWVPFVAYRRNDPDVLAWAPRD